MRADYGKGVGYASIDGQDIIYTISPGFFLTALDAETSQPLQNWRAGTIEVSETQRGGSSQGSGTSRRPYEGLPLERGYVNLPHHPLWSMTRSSSAIRRTGIPSVR